MFTGCVSFRCCVVAKSGSFYDRGAWGPPSRLLCPWDYWSSHLPPPPRPHVHCLVNISCPQWKLYLAPHCDLLSSQINPREQAREQNMLPWAPPLPGTCAVTVVLINESLSLCRHTKMTWSSEKYFGEWKSLYKCWQNSLLLINITPIFYLKFYALFFFNLFPLNLLTSRVCVATQ